MNFGKIKKEIGQSGAVEFVGRLVTFSLAMAIRLVPIADTGYQRSDKAPTHTILAKSWVHGEYVEVGSAWQNRINKGDQTGQAMFSLLFVIPEVLKTPLKVAAFPDRNEEGTWGLTADTTTAKVGVTEEQQKIAA